MLFLASFLTSIDCFVIGFSLKIEQKKLSFGKLLFLWLFMFLFYLFFLFVFKQTNFLQIKFHLQFHLFILLAFLALKKNNDPYSQISFSKALLLLSVNSIDGLFISITFLEKFNMFYLSLLFSIMTFLLFILGLKIPFKIKKKKYTLCILFLFLALLSLF